MWPLIFWYFLVVRFTLYKIPYIYGLLLEGGIYRIFPWQFNGQISSSPLIWLLIHVVTALNHLGLSIAVIYSRNESITRLHTISHRFFCGWVAVNIHHFGEASLGKALLGNGIPLLTMILTFNEMSLLRWLFREHSLIVTYKWLGPWIYLLALSSAPLLEAILYRLY